jgi:hypothetical protein
MAVFVLLYFIPKKYLQNKNRLYRLFYGKKKTRNVQNTQKKRGKMMTKKIKYEKYTIVLKPLNNRVIGCRGLRNEKYQYIIHIYIYR